MNPIDKLNRIGLNYKRSIREAKRFFKKNRLHEALQIIVRLRHHGYNDPELILLLAQVYDRLTILTGEAEYEAAAVDTYEEIIRYCNSRKIVKKAVKLKEIFINEIYALNDNETKARIKADEILNNNKNISPKAWYKLGSNFSVRKDPQFVINAYNNAISLNDKYIAAMYRLAYIYQYNLNDKISAVSLYLRLIKIPPYEDNIESESTNVKIIIEACTEISEIYFSTGNYQKVISVFDHAFKLFTAYGDIFSIINMKRIIANAYLSSRELKKESAFVNHIKKNFGYDLHSMLEELRIA